MIAETVSPATRAAYRMFAEWRRDLLNAGFVASGKPLAAYRALDAIVMGHNAQTKTALRAAEAALLEWSETHETTRAACAETLALVQAEISR